MWRFHDECMTITPIGRNTPFVRESVQAEAALGGGPFGDSFAALVELGELFVEPCSSPLDVICVASADAFVGEQFDQLDDRVSQFLEVGADLRGSVTSKVGQPSRLGRGDLEVARVQRISQLGQVGLLAQWTAECRRAVGAGGDRGGHDQDRERAGDQLGP